MKKKLMIVVLAMAVMLPAAGMAQTVKEDLSNAATQGKNEVVDGAEKVAGKSGELGRKGLDKVKEGYHKSKDGVKEGYNRTRDGVKEGYQKASDGVKRFDRSVAGKARKLERKFRHERGTADSVAAVRRGRLSADKAQRIDSLRMSRVRAAQQAAR